MDNAVIGAVNIVLSIFIIIGMGMYLTYRNRLNDQNASLISHLVVRVALPCMIISNLFGSFTNESLRECLMSVIAPVLSLLLTMGVGFLLAVLLHLEKKRRGAFIIMFAFSNSVFIGVPVSQALFGEAVLPFTLMYYIANTALFWTIGVALLRHDGGIRANGDFRALPGYLISRVRALIKRQSTPINTGAQNACAMVGKALPLPLVMFLICSGLVLCGLRLPPFVLTAAKYVGNMVTPLSLFFIGIVIMRMIRRKNFRWQKGYLAVMMGRFVLSPLIMLLCAKIFGLNNEIMVKALIVQAGMPIMSQSPIVADSMGSDAEYVAGGLAFSTLLTLIAIPIYMAML